MTNRAPRILLHGIGGVRNYGCEAIVRGTVHILRQRWPEADVTYASRKAMEDASMLADLELRIVDIESPLVHARRVARGFLRRSGLPRDWIAPETSRPARGMDVVLSIGGDIFTLPPPPIPRRPNLFQVDQALHLQRRAPFVMWGASIGPFEESPDALGRFRKALSGARLILVREQVSEDYMARLGLGDRTHQIADPAFVMSPDFRPGDWPFGEGKPVLGINLSSLSLRHVGLDPDGEALGRQIAMLDRLRRDLDVRLLLIPHVIEPYHLIDDDHVHLSRIHAALAESDAESVSLLPRFIGARRTKAVIARCAGLVAARMHCAVAGASQGVPTLFLAYSSKARGMALRIYGDEDWLCDLNDFEGDEAVAQVRRLLAAGSGLRERLLARMPALKEDAQAAAEHLARIMDL